MRDELEDESVSLVVTSPPFALTKKKEYGNEAEDDYVAWLKQFAEIIHDKLKSDGSFVLDLGGAYRKGRPIRSLYQFKVLIALCEELGERNFNLAQEFYWYNPSKMPLPAQWVNVDRSRVKDSVNVVWWLSKGDRPKADNTRVLTPYSKDMERLLERQKYNSGRRPGGSVVNETTWKRRHQGAIPPNVLQMPLGEEGADAEEEWTNFLSVGGSESASRYHRAYKALEVAYADDLDGLRKRARKHPARFPPQLPEFFIRFLTDEGDLVVDPFAGSNVTGRVCEGLGRSWKAFELHRFYLEPSLARFEQYPSRKMKWLDEKPPLLDGIDIS